MHALRILHRILSAHAPEIHTKRLASLLAAVEAVVTGSRLTLSDLGRGLSGSVAVKHNIKRVDRLLGNGLLHTEVPKLYEALVRQCLSGMNTPLIVIDWSDLTPDRKWQLLRASVAVEGRSMTFMNKVDTAIACDIAACASGIPHQALRHVTTRLHPHPDYRCRFPWRLGQTG